MEYDFKIGIQAAFNIGVAVFEHTLNISAGPKNISTYSLMTCDII